jgi:hypothetical protein
MHEHEVLQLSMNRLWNASLRTRHDVHHRRHGGVRSGDEAKPG